MLLLDKSVLSAERFSNLEIGPVFGKLMELNSKVGASWVSRVLTPEVIV